MNKRNKIIVSIVGITIVLLALLGITYAYYLTRIQGNTNTNSISVTTAKLELTYGDGNGILLPYGTIEPNSDKSIKFYKTDASGNPITNEPPVDNKTFTVTNNGNDSSYVVIIDNVSVTKVSDGSATTFVSNDFRYTLSCKKSDNTDCNNVSDLTIFPIKGGILVSNDIEEDDVHTYTLTMWYIDTGIDQSDDMGKSLQARVNITDVAQMENPFMTGVTATDNASLAYNIINNAKTNKNGTQFVNTPLTIPSAEISNVTNYKSIGEETNFSLNLSIENSYSSKTWYYYDTYVVDETSGKFTLTGKQSCTYSSCYSNLVGKYLYNKNPANNSNANNHTSDTKTNLPNVYKVTEATASTLKYVQVFNSPNEAERVLAPTTDDYGTSYYYRGAVEDNYLTFAGMCWRIVRIAGDGSVKIVLEDQDEACSTSMNGNWGIPTTTGGTTYTGNYGYELKNVDGEYGQEYIMSYLKPVNSAYKSMARAFYDFQEDKLEDYKSKLKSGNWCLADKAYTQSGSFPNYTYTLLGEYNYSSNMFYDSFVRLKGDNINGYQPTLKCTGTIMDKFESVTYNETEIIEEAPMYVSALTADEIVYAGGKVYSTNGNFYLLNENFKSLNDGYYTFWSLSPNGMIDYDRIFDLSHDGYMSYDACYSDNYAFRPAVSLASSAVISSGEGTRKNPYIIAE